MKVIDFETIRNMGITPLQCYEWVSDMLTKRMKQFFLQK